jgi:hypothetical protein
MPPKEIDKDISVSLNVNVKGINKDNNNNNTQIIKRVHTYIYQSP